MIWLILGPLIAAALAWLWWLGHSPYGQALLCELPGLLFCLLAGKAYLGQARRILETRARHSEPQRTLRALEAERERLVAERDALVQVGRLATTTSQPASSATTDALRTARSIATTAAARAER